LEFSVLQLINICGFFVFVFHFFAVVGAVVAVVRAACTYGIISDESFW